VTGKTGPWTLGLLDAITPEEHADVALLNNGTVSKEETAVEPLTNYFVGRAKRDWRAGATTVGGMLTSTIRDVDSNVFQPLLRSNATFGGLDFQAANQGRSW
jgi:hypothetical protein